MLISKGPRINPSKILIPKKESMKRDVFIKILYLDPKQLEYTHFTQKAFQSQLLLRTNRASADQDLENFCNNVARPSRVQFTNKKPQESKEDHIIYSDSQCKVVWI